VVSETSQYSLMTVSGYISGSWQWLVEMGFVAPSPWPPPAPGTHESDLCGPRRLGERKYLLIGTAGPGSPGGIIEHDIGRRWSRGFSDG
jgi:hypothetical protein